MTTLSQWWIALTCLTVILLALDYATRPLILLQITFVIPVGLAAQQLGWRAAAGFVVALSVLRFTISLQEDTPGQTIPIEFMSMLIRIIVLGIMAGWIHRDAVIRTQLREQTEGLQARLAAIVDGAQDAVVSHKLDGTLLSWNPGAVRLFDYTEAEMIGQSLHLLSPADRIADEDAIMEQVRLGERVEGYESIRRRKDGRMIPVGLTVSPIRNPRGVIAGASTIIRDLSQTKLAQRRFERILEFASDAVVIIDSHGRIVMVNSQAEKMFGYRGTELLGQSVELLIPERFRGQHPESRQQFFANPQVRAMGSGRELYGLRKDRGTFPLEINLSPLESEEGLLVASTIRDISDRKEAEAIIQKSLIEKETLLKEIHHRVKNNLSVISSLFYLQSTYTKDPTTLRILQESQERVRAMALVHESLYQSKDFAAVDFAEYAIKLSEQLVRSCSMTLPDSRNAIQLKTDLDHVKIPIDMAVPCGLILNELLSNALKHGFPVGHPGEIRVSMHRRVDGCYLLQVVDTGVGLPEGLAIGTATSLGLRLVRMLAQQIDAEFELVPADPGTEARLTIRVQNEEST